MKIISPLPTRRGRLEIIPLIDIMFFLLAAFMMVSIDKIRVKSLKVNLPTNVPTAQIEKKEDFITVSIDTNGQIQLDKDALKDKPAFLARLQQLYAQNKDQKFLISSDKDAREGDVVTVLGELRAAGFQKVAFSISGDPGALGSGASPAPASAPVANSAAPVSAAASTAPAPAAPAPPPDTPAPLIHP
jgi:biopolymer transport protein ExbD